MSDLDRMQELLNRGWADLRAQQKAISDVSRVCTSVYEDHWDAAVEQLIVDYPDDATRDHYAKQAREQIKGAHDVAVSIRKMQARRPKDST
jgi:hypothetical protein